MAASVKDVAALAGVSVGTVSNVLNRPDKVAGGTIERVHGAIEKLGFVRNDAARQLRVGRSLGIGLIILDASNPFFSALARGAEDRAARAGLSVLIGNSDEDVSREKLYLDMFEQQRVQGVLISPFGEILGRLNQLRERGIPAVLVDRTTADPSFSSVSVDDIAGGRLAADHLLSRGRRSIAFVGGPLDIKQVTDRLAGASHAVREVAGARLDNVFTDSLTLEAGRQAATEILGRNPEARPDAIFAANDLIAIGVLQTLLRNGVRVPDDIAIIGYDDIPFADAAAVPISSIRQPATTIGELAVELLLEQTTQEDAEPRQVELQPSLIVRESTTSSPSRVPLSV